MRLGQGRILPTETKGNRGGGLLDVAIGGKDRLLAFVEVGLIDDKKDQVARSRNLNDAFWQKVDQSHKYMDALYRKGIEVRYGDGDGSVLKVEDNGTIVFAVIVFDREKTTGRMAVFTAERKDEEDYRVALMWRRECLGEDGIVTLDRGYSAFINAVMHLSRNGQTEDDINWRYLGPNCSKVMFKGVRTCDSLRPANDRVLMFHSLIVVFGSYLQLSLDVRLHVFCVRTTIVFGRRVARP